MAEPIYCDSWWEPSGTAIAWAKLHSFAGWLGYFSQTTTDHIYHGWKDETFLAIKAAGLTTGAFCSGYDDPLWVKARAARLGIRAILDVESSIEGDGAWVDAWLAASGAGLYGVATTINSHRAHGHSGYVLAGYPSNSGTPSPVDPGLTWTVALPNPSRPIGRQWAGSVPSPFGGVDYSHFDPAFFAPAPPIPVKEDDMLIVNSSAGQWFLCGKAYIHIGTTADVTALVAAGVPQATVDDGFHAALLAAVSANGQAPVLGGTLQVSGSLTVG